METTIFVRKQKKTAMESCFDVDRTFLFHE